MIGFDWQSINFHGWRARVIFHIKRTILQVILQNESFIIKFFNTSIFERIYHQNICYKKIQEFGIRIKGWIRIMKTYDNRRWRARAI